MRRSCPRLVVVAFAGIGVGPSSCVFPGEPPTGVELSWRFPEQFGDAEQVDSAPVRTCLGALVDEVDVTVRDLDAPEREQAATYPCTAGFYGFEAPFVGTTDVFYELRPGTYAVDFEFYQRAEDASRLAVHAQTTLIEVDAKGIAPVALEISLDGASWEVGLAHPEACQTARFWLERAGGEDSLVGGEQDLGAYADNLESHQGWALDGQAQACSNLVAGKHRLETDRGHYTLNLEVDGQICQLPVMVGSANLDLDIDLANPCP